MKGLHDPSQHSINHSFLHPAYKSTVELKAMMKQLACKCTQILLQIPIKSKNLFLLQRKNLDSIAMLGKI